MVSYEACIAWPVGSEEECPKRDKGRRCKFFYDLVLEDPAAMFRWLSKLFCQSRCKGGDTDFFLGGGQRRLHCRRADIIAIFGKYTLPHSVWHLAFES